MIFNSVTFLLFLTVVVTLYWLLPKTARRTMLFAGSLIFYGFWRVEFTLLLLLAAVVDYYCSIEIEKRTDPKNRLNFLIISLIINLGLLFYFKYLMFVLGSAAAFLSFFGWQVEIPYWNIILPLGISFYTFETVSYTVDVYRGHIKAERNFLTYATFLLYFPHLIAGPILRASDILHQLEERQKFRLDYITKGLDRVLTGLFLKVVLADNIAPIVDEAFGQNLAAYSAIDVLTLAFLFGFQIYFDFSGYSHIAIGCAQMMGIHFPENFNFPYAATSFKDFWKRWHISLSSWIRDYLYLPLMGSKVVNNASVGIGNSLNEERGAPRRNRDLVLFLTWGIMGFWHGANWTFLVWGLYHASLIFLERNIQKWKWNPLHGKSYPVLGWMITLPFAMLGWIPFRAQTVQDTWLLWGKLFHASQYTYLGLHENKYIVAALLMMLFMFAYLAQQYLTPRLAKQPVLNAVCKTLRYGVAITLVFTFLRPISQFIYFQF
jgi:alginate O-acetyltransferase complex protein AlgI